MLVRYPTTDGLSRRPLVIYMPSPYRQNKTTFYSQQKNPPHHRQTPYVGPFPVYSHSTQIPHLRATTTPVWIGGILIPRIQ